MHANDMRPLCQFRQSSSQYMPAEGKAHEMHLSLPQRFVPTTLLDAAAMSTFTGTPCNWDSRCKATCRSHFPFSPPIFELPCAASGFKRLHVAHSVKNQSGSWNVMECQIQPTESTPDVDRVGCQADTAPPKRQKQNQARPLDCAVCISMFEPGEMLFR
jgi:hypothetical protein